MQSPRTGSILHAASSNLAWSKNNAQYHLSNLFDPQKVCGLFRGPVSFLSLGGLSPPARPPAPAGVSHRIRWADTMLSQKVCGLFRGPVSFLSLGGLSPPARPPAPAGVSHRIRWADTILSQKVCGLFGDPVSVSDLLYHTHRQTQNFCLCSAATLKTKGRGAIPLPFRRPGRHTHLSPSVG